MTYPYMQCTQNMITTLHIITGLEKMLLSKTGTISHQFEKFPTIFKNFFPSKAEISLPVLKFL